MSQRANGLPRLARTVCPACGQTCVPPELVLPRVKRRILEAVQRCPGISAEGLRNSVWSDDPNGGPECRHGIHVHIHQLNRRLEPFGIAVRAPRGGSGGYQLQRITTGRGGVLR
jgi:hypothetical protein